MIKNQKYIFLYAFILALIIFSLGIFMGYLLESSRINKINTLYLNAEMELLDQTLQRDMIGATGFNQTICQDFVNENINFGDEIFQEAQQIQKYEDANKINGDIVFQHKRYDLLRTLFWMNSIVIKQKCNASYNDVVYFYKYNNPSIEQDSDQKALSNLLIELKNKYGNNVMLIPIAGDNNISSINLLMEQYSITQLPAILINEKIKLTRINSMSEIEKYLN